MREELPAVAAARMAQIRSSGTWGSSLTVGEFAAVRSAGFEPVGQVLGASVYGAGSARASSCPPALGPVVQAMYQARHTAIERMTSECAQLGGHGVVGVRLSRGSFSLGGLEFTAIGTAVRAPGAVGERREPFTCDLSGQDFAKLITAGWVPAGLALGVSIGSRHDDRTTARQARWTAGNAEVAGWTELVNESRREARRQLEDDVRRLGAEGVVIAAMQLRVSQRDCPAAVGRRDHLVEATVIGTAIVRFSRAGPRPAELALTVMPLDSRRTGSAGRGSEPR
ncbi:MAG: heavy metal-binding domain-containing protein [Streptosporangiaceae bacterium]